MIAAPALGLTSEQARVLDRYHTRFVRAGAALDKPAQDRLAAINERLASLGTQFGQNVLADETGLCADAGGGRPRGPAGLCRAAARGGGRKSAARAGKYAITLARSSCEGFLQFSARRDLREKVFQAWIKRGENGGTTDNRAIITELMSLRGERARLLGYATYADYRLDDQMAKTPQAARKLLDEVWGRGRAKAAVERDALQKMSPTRAAISRSAPQDWRYYSEKLRKAKYELDEAEIKHLLPARQDYRSRLRNCAPPVRADLHAGQRAALSRRRAGVGSQGRQRHPRRPVHRRLFRAQLQAQRRLDDSVARPGKTDRRCSPDHPECVQFLQASGRRTCATIIRRRPHAVPRIRPRLARSHVERDLSIAGGHQCQQRFCRAAFTALRALAGSAGDFAEIRTARDKPASRCRKRCSTGYWRPVRSIRASALSNTLPAHWSISIFIR